MVIQPVADATHRRVDAAASPVGRASSVTRRAPRASTATTANDPALVRTAPPATISTVRTRNAASAPSIRDPTSNQRDNGIPSAVHMFVQGEGQSEEHQQT